MLGQVRYMLGQVRLGIGQVRIEQEGQYIDMLGQVRFDCIRPTRNRILRISFSNHCSVPGQVRQGQVRLGQVYVRLGQVRYRLGQVRFAQENYYIDILGYVRFDCIRPTKNMISEQVQQTLLGASLGQVRLVQVQVRLGQDRLGIGQVRFEQEGQFLTSQVWLGLIAYAQPKM